MVQFVSITGVLLLSAIAVVAEVTEKRRWVAAPIRLRENVDYTLKNYIAWIRSTQEVKQEVFYCLKGAGADSHPFHVFVVSSKTGLIKVTRILDREMIDTYNISGCAVTKNGETIEDILHLQFKVVDENDNAPTFPSVIEPGEVLEHSPAGTEVMTVTATDLDEPGNPNSQMVYSLLKQQPPSNIFYMKPNGTIFVKRDIPDRETVNRYVLTVQAQDLDGDPKGLTGTSAVTINVQDILN